MPPELVVAAGLSPPGEVVALGVDPQEPQAASRNVDPATTATRATRQRAVTGATVAIACAYVKWAKCPSASVLSAMPEAEVGPADESVVHNFTDLAGRLQSIPVQRKKRLAVLRWLVEDFQPGRMYAEAEVNRIIGRRHPDYAALRRHLVDEELMQRRRGVYWRAGSLANVGWDPPGWPGSD